MKRLGNSLGDVGGTTFPVGIPWVAAHRRTDFGLVGCAMHGIGPFRSGISCLGYIGHIPCLKGVRTDPSGVEAPGRGCAAHSTWRPRVRRLGNNHLDRRLRRFEADFNE